jgi:hypothetical protein
MGVSSRRAIQLARRSLSIYDFLRGGGREASVAELAAKRG